MVDRVRAKEEAKAVLRDNNRGTCVLALLLNALISIPCITAPASQLGLQGLYLRMSRGSRERAGNVLQGFDRFGGALLLSLWIWLWMFLWVLGPMVLVGILGAVSGGMLLLILAVPLYIAVMVIGVWKGLQYMFAFFVMADNPGIPVRESLRRSIELARGNVGALFVTGLSFLGWTILSSFTFGILMLVHVGPYMLLTSAKIYDQLAGGAGSAYGYTPPTGGYSDTPPAGGAYPPGGGGGSPYGGTSGYGDSTQGADIPYEAPPVRPPEGGCGLKGVTGMYSGYEMDLRPDETVLVGRDGTQVHVVISSGAERVSRRHCSIRYDSRRGCYVVVDFSKNGSFREDGSRLRSNTEECLRRGEVLYLGDRSNGFRLK